MKANPQIIRPHHRPERRSYSTPLSVWPILWALGVGTALGLWLSGHRQKQEPRVTTHTVEASK